MATTEVLEIIYDGECPICQNMMLKRKLTTNDIQLILTDARMLTNDQLQTLTDKGYDINKGMLVYCAGNEYYGHEAMQFILAKSEHSSILMKAFEQIYIKLNQPRLYAILVKLRLLLLRLLGKSEIKKTSN